MRDLATLAASVISPNVQLLVFTFQGVPGEGGASGATGPRVSWQTPLRFAACLSGPAVGAPPLTRHHSVTLSPFRESAVSLEREELPVPRVCRVLEVFPELQERTDLR